MRHLIAAAQRGKEVTAVVELMARFDEEANINWAEQLEKAGAHVVYGVVGHKTHAKMALVVRREGGKLKRYAHLGTGNYHPAPPACIPISACSPAARTCARTSTTCSSSSPAWARPQAHLRVAVALHDARAHDAGDPQRDGERPRKGEKAFIIAKMNALLEPRVIAAFYEASQAGVKIDLIVRGGVRAAPGGIPALREHPRALDRGPLPGAHRIFYFCNGGEETVSRWPAPTGWTATSSVASRPASRCWTRSSSPRVINEGLKPYLKDNTQGLGNAAGRSAGGEDLIPRLRWIRRSRSAWP
jgi:polyphosphate kinase